MEAPPAKRQKSNKENKEAEGLWDKLPNHLKIQISDINSNKFCDEIRFSHYQLDGSDYAALNFYHSNVMLFYLEFKKSIMAPMVTIRCFSKEEEHREKVTNWNSESAIKPGHFSILCWKKVKFGQFHEIVGEFVNRYLNSLKNCVKSIHIDTKNETGHRLLGVIKIRNYGNLDVLLIEHDGLQNHCVLELGIIDFSTISQVRQSLVIPFIKLGIFQIMQLKAEWIQIILLDVNTIQLSQIYSYWKSNAFDGNVKKLRIGGEFSIRPYRGLKKWFENQSMDPDTSFLPIGDEFNQRFPDVISRYSENEMHSLTAERTEGFAVIYRF